MKPIWLPPLLAFVIFVGGSGLTFLIVGLTLGLFQKPKKRIEATLDNASEPADKGQ